MKLILAWDLIRMFFLYLKLVAISFIKNCAIVFWVMKINRKPKKQKKICQILKIILTWQFKAMLGVLKCCLSVNLLQVFVLYEGIY